MDADDVFPDMFNDLDFASFAESMLNSEAEHNGSADGMGFDMNSTLPLTYGLGTMDFLPPELPDAVKTTFIVTYIFIMLLAVAGNAFVVIVIGVNQKMRSVTNMFLVSLAVSDMLIAVLNMPFQLMFYIQNEWTLGELICKFSKYIQGVVIVVSIFTLCGIALDRYYAICHPLRARHVHTVKRAAIIICILWVVSFVIVCPQLSVQRIEPIFSIEGGQMRMVNVCVEYFSDDRLSVAYTLALYIFIYLLPVTTMLGTYGMISHTLWARGPIGETPDLARESQRRHCETKRIVRMLATIVVLFAVSWFPFFTGQVYLLFHAHTDTTRIVMAFFHLFGYSNSCVNPILYCFLNDSFQQQFLRMLCCRCFWARRKQRGHVLVTSQSDANNVRSTNVTSTNQTAV